MGNIVSNAVVPNQLPNSQAGEALSPPQSGVPPVQAPQPSEPVGALPPNTADSTSSPSPAAPPSTNTIEGIESPTPTGFNVDPFGPMATPPDVPSLDSPPEPPSITPEAPPPPAPQPLITQPSETAKDATTRQSAADLLAKMPDITQMMKDLEKSGCLLPELQIKSTKHLDTSPLAALQPQQLKDQSYFSSPTDAQPLKVLPEVQLASTHPKDVQPKELPLYVFVAIFSLLQALMGLIQTAHFAYVKYPTYEQMIVANVITTTEVDTAVVKAIIVGIMAAVGLLFGALLLIKRSKNRSVDLYVVISIVLINFFVQNVLVGKELSRGNPLQIPEMIGEIVARFKP